jgi:hypothetical protein
MRVAVGLFLVVGLITVGCSKKDPAQDQQIGVDNGVVLGEGQAPTTAVPTPGVVTPTKVSQPLHPAFGAIGATPGVVGATPTQPVAVQAPPAAPIAPASPAATPAAATPVVVKTTPAATPAVGVAGRGVPPPPGGRPKPGTK